MKTATKRTSVSMTRQLHTRLRAHSNASGLRVEAVVARAIEQYLKTAEVVDDTFDPFGKDKK